MKNMIDKSKNVLSKPIAFFILAIMLLWMKTYIGYKVEFNLGIDNRMQELLLFLNPLSSAILFFGLALFSKGKKAFTRLIVLDSILSFVLYANIVYYRFFTDFITLPTLTQTKNAGDLGQSITALIRPYDVLYFLDTILLFVLVAAKVVKPEPIRTSRRKLAAVFVTGFLVLSTNVALAEGDRPQLLTRGFDRNYIVKYLGMYNYHIYDALQSTKSYTQRALSDSTDMTEIINYTKATRVEPNPQYFAKAKGKNVIYVHLESLQNFMINYKLNGQEVTPFLNSLVNEKNTMYFNNFFQQTGQGKSSDAEFMLENSLFGLPQGASFTTKGQNTYQAAPAILGQQGYTSAVFHGNYKSFWNRDEIYKQFGYDNFFDASYYSMKEEDVLNYGLKDKPFFEESKPLLDSLKQPFYAKFITLSNHFPYPIDEEDATIEKNTTGDPTVDNYFRTARYLDESIKGFYDYLKQSGLYENSIIVMYGDHYGISDNRKNALSKALGKEVNDFEYAQLQRVPLFIRIPGVQGGIKSKYGGQIDVLPTLFNFMGIDTKNYIQFGSDLMAKGRQQVVVFRNGDFVTPKVTSIDNKYYKTATGEEIKKTAEIEGIKKYVEMKLNFSDKVVYGDLLRFYTPKGFKPVDPANYDYKNKEENVLEEKTSNDK
ncbi:LTA synthase family protein [Peribacillus cavernae]|uniref:LTA synthase family protein n=1 Tax=Peribacillus cavernae TaxID=1674310 RepID=A0A3S0VPE6_9BACI|nr:LTA synthase family protein [Peribacillus cavernae]MDQ0219980.1 lipoteichoic acid synthase [Peribacillus cavernae]RUQ32045.1 LTA synthase family protein [Peribacillus cavernae]